jgi:hypothetical protein
MANSRPTKKQKALIAEINHLTSALRLDCSQIMTDDDSGGRTTCLELAKNQLIRSEVILKYVLMDEFLSAIICWYYFGKRRGFPQLWKTKRFKLFNHFILERLYLLQKLDLVQNIHKIPKWVNSELAALNDLRNGISHSFFPENRRKRPEWKGQSIFTKDGFDQFLEDMYKLSNFFYESFWRGSPEDTA